MFKKITFQTQKKLEFKQLQLDQERAAKEKAEREKEELEKRLALEKEKNTYLLTSSRSMSEDAKGMVHTIKIISQDIQSLATNTYEDLKNGDVSKEKLLADFGSIIFQADKAMKISKLITRANFKDESENKKVNVIAYISQYLDIYKDIVDNSHVQIEKKLDDVEFVKKISVLDIAVIIDNLISNSQKAGAKNVLFEGTKMADGKLRLTVSDDGEGLNLRFRNTEDSIFELGVTTTDGSGIGLHTVKTVVEGWRGTVRYVGDGIKLKGATFEIIIP